MQRVLKVAYALVPMLREPIYRRILWEAANEEGLRARAFGVIHRAEWSDVKQHFSKQTVYVLGSGSSINNMRPQQIDRVRRGTSIGINWWPVYHKHISTFYMVESTECAIWDSLEHVVHHPQFVGILSSQYLARGKSSHQVKCLPHNLRNVTFSYVSSPVVGFYPKAYGVNVVQVLEAANWFTGVVAGPRRTSVERAIVMAAAGGASRIVLCGVDLQGAYFWEQRQHDEAHSTSAGESFRRSAAARILHLAAILQERTHVRIFLAEDTGRLSGKLPVFSWREGQ